MSRRPEPGALPPPPPWHIDPESLRDVADDQVALDASIAALLARLDAPDLTPEEELALRARLGAEARLGGRHDLAVAVLRAALELAERAGNPRQRLLARLRLAVGPSSATRPAASAACCRPRSVSGAKSLASPTQPRSLTRRQSVCACRMR